MSEGARTGTVIAVVLLAANLRPAVVAVSPLLAEIRADTGLSSPAAALLTTLPVLCFGLLAPVAPVLARRVGLVPALAGVLCAMTAGGLLRLPEPTVLLFAGTVVFGAAIAVGNVLLPVLVKREFADRTGTLMGAYSVSLSTGAAIAAGAAVPLLMLLGGDWRRALAFWAVPPALALLAWLPLLRGRGARVPEEATDRPRVRLRHAPLAWAITGFMGLQSLVYYATVAWLPEILVASGSGPERAGYALSVFNLVGIAASVFFTVTVGRTRRQIGYAIGSAVLYAAGFGGLLIAPGTLDFLWATLLGLAQGTTISLALALILLRMPDAGHAARMSGMAQGFGYLLAAGGPVLAGAVHDATGGWTWPLLLLGALLVPMAATGAAAGRHVVLKVPTEIGVRS